MAYIYKIENQINHKIYIGKTEKYDPYARWKEHKKEANKSRSQSRALYRAINKYGINNFTYEILEETNNPNEREIYYIAFYNSFYEGYNETIGGDGKAYLQLPEKEICEFYLKNKTLLSTAKNFNCDSKTIKEILLKNNIKLYDKSIIYNLTSSTKKAVEQLDKNTEKVIAVFESVQEAERTGLGGGHIKDVCHGKRKTAGGYKWRFKEQ